MSVKVIVQRPFRGKTPSDTLLARWVRRAIRPHRARAEITLRIVGTIEGAALNRRWRGQAGPTNVLSFPLGGLEPGEPLLGDVVICGPVVTAEAAEERSHHAHWAHIVIHGALHLLGFDHRTTAAARTMEKLERHALADAGFPDPYREIGSHERRPRSASA